jgi:hypothetical protein
MGPQFLNIKLTSVSENGVPDFLYSEDSYSKGISLRPLTELSSIIFQSQSNAESCPIKEVFR